MPMTLAALLKQPTLGLTALTGADALRREISWVHASELADPTPYLDGGELLLSIGMWLDPVADRSAQRAQVAAYVDRLVDAGVVGLGFGVGLQHAEAPVGLVDAADARGLPLIQVPEHTAFVAIGRSVWEALAADQNAEMTRTSTAQQDLTRAAVAGGASGLIRRLAQRLDGWALLLDAGGAVQHAAPTGADRRLPGWAPSSNVFVICPARSAPRSPWRTTRLPCSHCGSVGVQVASSQWAARSGSAGSSARC